VWSAECLHLDEAFLALINFEGNDSFSKTVGLLIKGCHPKARRIDARCKLLQFKLAVIPLIPPPLQTWIFEGGPSSPRAPPPKAFVSKSSPPSKLRVII